MFGEISPENRAAIVRTHLERWIAANRDRLTPDQLGILEEIRAFVKSDLYRPIFEPETERRADELEARAAALFSPEDRVQALTVRGAYIPPEGSGR